MTRSKATLLILLALSFIFLGLNIRINQIALGSEKPENISQLSSQIINKPLPTPKPKTTTIILAGDTMLGRTVTSESLDKHSDPKHPFLKVSDELQKADLVFVNLENPIVDGCPRHYSGYKFCAPPEMLEGLVFAGIDLVTIANNHTKNYGEEGFRQTKRYLDDYGVSYVGSDNFVSKKVGDVVYGFLGFDFFSKNPAEADYELVRKSAELSDFLIVSVHWGQEYQSIANSSQNRWAEELVNAGANLIVGHHPHWVQNFEDIAGTPVYYSLGNFVFDQMWGEETKSGLVLKVIFEGSALKSIEHLPTYMSSWAQPKFK